MLVDPLRRTAPARTAVMSELKWNAVVIGAPEHGISNADGCDWVIVDGFEVTGARLDGIKLNGDHNVVRNCWVHTSSCMGIAMHDKTAVLRGQPDRVQRLPCPAPPRRVCVGPQPDHMRQRRAAQRRLWLAPLPVDPGLAHRLQPLPQTCAESRPASGLSRSCGRNLGEWPAPIARSRCAALA